jgi:hypothetical protein
MPTGLTANLDDNDLSTQRWVLEVLALQCFGTFYDTSFGRTEEQLEEAIVDDRLSYYTREYVKAIREQKKIKDWTPEQWKSDYYAMVNGIVQQNAESIKESSKQKAKHDKVYGELQKLYDNSKCEVVQEIAKFGMKQLDTVNSETKPYITKIPKLEEYIRERKKSMARDVEYCSVQIKNITNAIEENLAQYQTLREEVHRILDPPK